jgi:hypothetical protein
VRNACGDRDIYGINSPAKPQETKPTVRTRWRPIEALPAAVQAAEMADENVSDECDQTP